MFKKMTGAICGLMAGAMVLGGVINAPLIAEASEGEEVTLRFLGWKTGKEEGALPEIIEGFEKENPGVKIEYEAIPTTNNYNDVLNTRLSTGEGSDIYMVSDSMLRSCVKNGYAEDLSDIDFAGEYQDNVKKLLSPDGKFSAIPIEEAGIGMIVNMDVLRAAGVETLPQTWSQLTDACEKVKENGGTPFIMGNKTGWSGAIIMCYGKYTEFMEYDNDIYTKVLNGEKTMGDMYGKYFEKYSELIEKGYTNGQESLGMEFNEGAVTEFVKGNSAFLMAGTWMISEVSQALDGAETVFTAFPINDEEPLVAQCSLSTALAVNSESEHKDLAIKFLQYFNDNENLKLYVESQNAFSPLIGGTSMSLPEAEPFAESLAANNVTVGCEIPQEFTVDEWTFVTKAAQSLTLQEVTPEELNEQFNAEFDKAMMLQGN